MQKPITLSIFFPAYNEEANIEETLLRTVRVVEDSPYIANYELIVIDDGSADQTRERVLALARRHKSVRLVRHEKNQGYGAALKTGIHAARMEYVFFTDADLQFDIVELQNLIVHLAEYPVVIGYRAPRRDPLMRLINAWGWNRLNRIFFGLKVRDIDCAFKLFRRQEVQDLSLTSSGAMISAEVLTRLARRGVPLKEVPVSHQPRRAGSPTGASPAVIARAFGEMISLYRGELGMPTHKEALRFMTVGILNTALDAAAYIFLTRETLIFSEHLTVAKFISFLCGTVSSLLLNRSWTFGLRHRLSVGEVVRFYAVTSLSITLNVAVMNFLVGLGMYDLAALGITTVLTFLANFTLSKFWVFAKKNPKERYAPTF